MKLILFLFLGISFLTPCFSESGSKSNLIPASMLYVENKSQFIDQFGLVNNTVKYFIQRKGFNIHLNKNYFSYEIFDIINNSNNEKRSTIGLSKEETNIVDSLKYHRVDIYLIGANEHPVLIPSLRSHDYLNYYNRNTVSNEIISNVYGYEKVTYKDIYQNIDLEFIVDSLGKPEYQFRIHPGGNPNDIKLSFNGALNQEIVNDKLKIILVNSDIEECIPRSYIVESGLNVESKYLQIDSSTFGYSIKDYNSKETLVIDPLPERTWGTYFGGNGSDVVLSSFVHSNSDLYVTGSTNSSNSIATVGSHQNTIGGNLDAFLVRYTSNGARIWSTYYGGTGDDIGYTVLCDNSSNVYISGQTSSSSNISTTGSHQTNFGGNADAFIAKFNSSGSRLWGTYYGGPTYEYGYLAYDGNSIYLAGRTESSTSIATGGAYQTSISGLREAYLAKFSLDGTRSWGTYIGGPEHEYLYAVKCDASGNVIVAGATGSTSQIATSGAHQTSYAGGFWDTFLMKFSQTGNLLWGTYCGVSSDDQAYSLATDNNSNVFVAGIVKSSSGMGTNGSHQQNYGGGPWDSYLVKFNSNGIRQWGTYFGGSGDESGGYGCTVSCDSEGNVILSGSTNSSANISTSGAYQLSNSGMEDAYVVKFNSNGTRLWSTYYGGPGNDYGTSISNDGNFVYLTGSTNSTTSIATSGGSQNTFGGGIQDAFIVKLNSTIPQSITVTNAKTNYCQGESFSLNYNVTGTFNLGNSFSVQLSNSSGSFSNPTVIGSLNSTSNGTINCVIPSSTPFGSGYRIRVVSSNPVVTGTDNGNNLTINPIPTPIVSGSNIVCNESTNNYTIPSNSGRTYQWSAPSKGLIIGTSTSNSVNVKWTSIGVDTLKVRETISSTGCFSDAIYIITINSLPNPSITGLQQLCFKQSNVSYSVPNIPGNSYQWYQPTRGTIIGSTDGNSCLVNWNVASGIDSIKVRQTNLSTGCFKDVVMSVLINPLPIPVITGTANVCTNQSGLTYTVPFISGHTYQWFNPSLGQIISGGNSNVVTVNWGSISGVEQLKVRQINSLTGCTSDTTITITVNPTPTPSISGANSVCLNQSDVQYSVPNIPGHTYEWFTPVRGVIISGRYSNSCSINWSISKGTDIIRVRQINSLTGCSKDTSLSITINDTPSPTIVGLNTVCLGNSDVKYSATFVPGHTYQWSSVSNGTITSLLNSNELFIRWNKKSGIDTVKVTQTDIQTGCSTSQNYIVTINPAPTTNIIGPKEVCENQQQIVFRTSKNNGSSYTWRPESANLFIQGSNGRDSVVINFGTKGTALLRLKEMNSFGCEKDTVFAITVNSNIQPQITTDDNKFVICKGSTKKLASSLFGDNYVWKLNGNIIPNLNTREITIDKGGSYSVNVISKDCGGESNEFVIVELPNPIPIILGNKTVTPQSKNVAYQVNNNSGSQYNWSITGNGKIVSTQTGSVILVDFTDIGSAILTVTEVNSNGCVKDTSMNISISNSTNIDEELNTNNLVIYPNPMNEFGSVMVKAFIPPSMHASVSIVDMLGKNLITTELDGQNAYREIHVPISTESLINGIYMIQLRMDGNVVSKKLIINR